MSGAIQAWNDLVAARESRRLAEIAAGDHAEASDRWVTRAPDYDRRVRAHAFRDETVWNFLLSILPPQASVLDIGAGTGRWAVPLAAVAEQVTALEPSAAMRERLTARLTEQDIHNVTICEAEWPAAEVPVHDVSLCMHAMYGARDFAAWIQRMQEVTRGTCVLYLRNPTPADPLCNVAEKVWGNPHIVPDFAMARAALREMGIEPGILEIPPGTHPTRRHGSFAEAVAWARQRMRLPPEHLPLLEETLRKSICEQDGFVEWPDTNPAALLYWPQEFRAIHSPRLP